MDTQTYSPSYAASFKTESHGFVVNDISFRLSLHDGQFILVREFHRCLTSLRYVILILPFPVPNLTFLTRYFVA